MKKLIKSYKFWTTLAGALGLLAVSIGKTFGFEITASGVEEIIMAVCGILVVFGIVKKPKQSKTETDTQDQVDQDDKNIIEK